MVETQPGKVATFDPSVTLANYDDSDRTRFLHNGTQYVKAKLIASRASFAYVGYYTTENVETTPYTKYLTTTGKFALIDTEKFIPIATGAPVPGLGQHIIVSYPVQVSTASIVFYSTVRIDFFAQLKVEYSFDGVFYFAVSGETVGEAYDNNIQRTISDSPPTGEYVYTITLGATYSARFFKITSYASTSNASPISQGTESTLSVTDTTGFPDSWAPTTGMSLYNGFAEGLGSGTTITYTGKTSTTFTGVTLYFVDSVLESTWTQIDAATTFFFHPSWAENVTEVDIVPVDAPLLEIWDTDGSQASTQDMDSDFYLDVVWDNAANSYFGIRYTLEFDGTGGAGFLLGDDFDDLGSGFNTTRWLESTTSPNWQHNTTSGTADYLNTAADGSLITRYYLDGDFTVDIEPGFNRFDAETGRIEIRSVDKDTDNAFVQMGIHGPWSEAGPKGNWESSQFRVTVNTTGGSAQVRNLRMDTRFLPEGSEDYILTYVAASNLWTVASGSGGTLSNLDPNTSYNSGPLSLSVVHSATPADGSQLTINSNLTHQGLPSTSPWTWKIGLKKSGTSLIARYDEGSGLVDWNPFPDTSDLDHKIELFSSGVSGTLDLSADNYTVTGTGFFDSIPVFSVEALNSAGNVAEVIGLTDADGFLIKKLDIINLEADYNEYISDRVQIATDGQAGGAVYFKIGTVLYKYNRSSFPLDLEQGATAAVTTTGEIAETAAKALSYNQYPNAGLAFIEYDTDRAGTYVKTIDTTDLTLTEFESLLDVSSSNYPFAWDVNNYNTLYYVDAAALKQYDMDEGDVAFTNVVSVEKIMSAGTSESSSVTATVLNVYGEPMSAKTVTFTVSAGDGAVSPSVVCSTASGTATTTYTVGTTVGLTTLTASASDVAC